MIILEMHARLALVGRASVTRPGGGAEYLCSFTRMYWGELAVVGEAPAVDSSSL